MVSQTLHTAHDHGKKDNPIPIRATPNYNYKELRHGPRQTRSVSQERIALQALKPLLVTFGGGVDLTHPDCKLYVLDGIQLPPSTIMPVDDASTTTTTTTTTRTGTNNTTTTGTILARRLSQGARVSCFAPKTRICVTTTPLCPIAATCLCNAAQIQPHAKILDPYGGSATILLAAAFLEPTVQSISIEVAHNGYVNRSNIGQDFVTRNLTAPIALIQGDSTDWNIRQHARFLLQAQELQHQKRYQLSLVGENQTESKDDHYARNNENLGVFDCIITDPPYGIRESTSSSSDNISTSPLQDLLAALIYDRDVVGHRLLRKGGKLVCFLPSARQPTFYEQDTTTRATSTVPLSVTQALPTTMELDQAGLQLVTLREQPLNDNLSRWLVVFDCVR